MGTMWSLPSLTATTLLLTNSTLDASTLDRMTLRSGCSTPWSTCASAVSMLHRLSLPSRTPAHTLQWSEFTDLSSELLRMMSLLLIVTEALFWDVILHDVALDKGSIKQF